MLELKGITKEYPAGENTVHALRGIDLKFRKNEFVSILGPSGCGKTTMLNIIGGLDKYTSGDLLINSISTKSYKDRDWDAYRNHSIGFVFQSYNLIPHQSVLQNVELALTLSGVGKKERRERAKQALIKVGLGDQLKKKPSEMSGGQMQRVAIARALVNNPDIILADEPTGALDTETSLQVMEILKEVASDRLVIMVTHNPELAEKYSTRIIKMLDGKITGDSSPLSEEEAQAFVEKEPAEKIEKVKKPSMSLFTGFTLSLKNLFSKKGRTMLTSFAGSIGIIGIALIFAVSQGTTNYIDDIQEETLTSYPLTIQATNVDISTLMQTFMGSNSSAKEHEKDAVYSQPIMFDMVNALNNIESTENDLKSFKAYIEEQMNTDTAFNNALSGVQYTYNYDLLVYTKNQNGDIIRSDSSQLLSELLAEHLGMTQGTMEINEGSSLSTLMNASSSSMMGPSSINLWCEMLSGKDGDPISPLLKDQYDMVYGSWPNSYNEVVLVVNENNELDDLTLYALGLKSKEDIDLIFNAVNSGEEITPSDNSRWEYEDICNMNFKVILNADCYTLDEASGLYTDLRDSETGLRYLYDNALNLKVTGIIRPNEDATSSMLSGSIAYTKGLTEYISENAKDSAAIKAQLESKDTDIFTLLPFKENTGNLTSEQKKEEFKAYVSALDTNKKAETYIKIMSIPSREQLDKAKEQALANTPREQMEATLISVMSQQTSMNRDEMTSYISKMDKEELDEVFARLVEEQVKAQTAAQAKAALSSQPAAALSYMLDTAVESFSEEQFADYYDNVLEFAQTSYEDNLRELGFIELDDPFTINLFASSFENKDILEDKISEYNEGVEELKRISYTDIVGIMMSSMTTIINAITYVLIAFVAISLIVSSIMIGVITLISVQERTKEIGILRAIGASKRNVSNMFNAETVIIGFASGLFGIVLTYLLCIPINAIIHALTGISNLSAHLPLNVALILIAISVLLTLFAGIIPSRSAAKKDPVVALRTE